MESPAPEIAPRPRLHLPFLDGIRALMALYVVHHHILGRVQLGKDLPDWTREILAVGAYGHYPVVVFIVLSGYCLMLPVVRNGGLKGGFRLYIARRARRILPPYYFALLFSAIILIAPVVAGLLPTSSLKTPWDWISHLLLVHNFQYSTAYSLNAALWSIATEWQIYFFFPFLLIPIWNRAGNFAAILAGSLVGLGLWAIFPSIWPACPWFLGLFALGMAGAALNFDARLQNFTSKIPWGALATLLIIGGYLLVRIFPQFSWYELSDDRDSGLYPVADFVFGVGAMALLVWGTRVSLENRPHWLLKMLSNRPILWIGAFSYSLYLIHMPVLLLFLGVLKALKIDRFAQYAILMGFYFPFVVLLGYAFYLKCEKPFLNARPMPNSKF